MCNNYNPRIMKAQYPLSFQSNSYVALIKPEENTCSVCSDIKVYQNHKLHSRLICYTRGSKNRL